MPDVTVILDNWRTAITDARGYHEFKDVSEGSHPVAVDVRRLPVDFDPPDILGKTVTVLPQGRSRTDFVVNPLDTITGRLSGPEGVDVNDVAVKLEPGDRRTTTDRTGYFRFEGLQAADYLVTVDPGSLPQYVLLRGESTKAIRLKIDEPAPIDFEVEVIVPQKPVRQVPLELTQ